MSDFDWDSVKSATRRIWLEDLGMEFSKISGRLYRLGDCEFALVSRFLPDEATEGPASSMFFWAPSVGAAKRVALDDESDDDERWAMPPTSLLVGGRAVDYASILAACKTGRFGPHRECLHLGVHRGRIGRYIAVDIFNYYFRSPADDAITDQCFAVGVDIARVRWLLAGK
jgi:hypothetical protein